MLRKLWKKESEKLTKDDVLWCYRALLGREPESESIVQQHLLNQSFKKLVEVFVSSQEFQQKRKRPVVAVTNANNTNPAKPVQHSLVLQSQSIDTVATQDQLQLCCKKIKEAWTHLGQEKAHFSVLTNEKFLPGNLDESLEIFWSTGESEIGMLLRVLNRHGFVDLSNKSCVEYGCGVGRATMSLARHFKFVDAYDISSNHLAFAERKASEEGISNIRFHECADDISLPVVSCDFYYSRIVFQHNPPPIISVLIENALKALNPGGLAFFQVPTYCVNYSFNLKEWLATSHSLDMQMHCLPQKEVFEIVRRNNCVLLELREDDSTGASDRFISNTFIIQKNPSN